MQLGFRRSSPCLPSLFLVCALLAAALPAAAVESGDPAPDFRLPALSGPMPLSLSEYRGKVVYLDFWASWCGPCLVSLPLLEELRREFSPRDFQVLAVNLDDDPSKARRFLDKRPVGYPSAHDPKGAVPGRFGVETMPTSYLIDRQGVVRHVHPGFRKADIEDLRQRVRALVGEGR